MSLIWGLSPFIVYVGMARAFSVDAAMWSAFGLALVALARSLSQGRSLKLLEIGNVALFGVLGLVTLVAHPRWTVGSQRLIVDLGMAAITGGTILFGRPFTLQYARERAPPSLWETPRFIAANVRISAVWAGVFGVLALLDLGLLVNALGFVPFAVLTLLVLAAGLGFTLWYPRRLAGRAGVPPAA